MTKREEIRELKRQVAALEQRVQALEARPIAYTSPLPFLNPFDLTPVITCGRSGATGTVIPGLAWN